MIMAVPASVEEPIIGRASVIDGDTIEIAGERIRLNGIDAPESWQRCQDENAAEYRCGKEAAFALDQWLAESRPTRCVFVERDRYRRFVGTCFRSDGYEVNRWLVETGNSLDWPRYSDGLYADAQARAKANRLGIWRGTFTEPCIARGERAKRKPSC
ncbi:thermonuclease family protein [Shinella sp. HZN7]|uniref:thermonuclease family protein n=1 Tax=Shinella sp. (strain HZN7) TaxID=879274 RepID=UPI00352A9799